jgi:hypothetical protein
MPDNLADVQLVFLYKFETWRLGEVLYCPFFAISVAVPVK